MASAAVCLPGAERPRLGGEPATECAGCDVPERDIDHDPGHPCRLSSRTGVQIFPLRTQDRHFGFLLLKLEERERYAPYEPFVGNLANSLAVNIERRWQRDHLEAANVELRRHREHLGELVRERTAELQLGLKREHHLTAVLRAIRNVNQLIVREKDRERLLQRACGILGETRGFRCVWIVHLGADGRVEATAEAGIGPAFAGLRSQLERGELPECCRRALASAGAVVLTNPVVNCAACPLPTEYRDTAGIAAPLRHEGRTYGVLIAPLPAEMAADAEEISLFAEVAGDLAFGLHDIESEQQRKRAEQQIRRAKEEWERTFDALPDPIALIDTDHRITRVNRAMGARLGKTFQQAVGARCYEAVHVLSAPPDFCPHSKLLVSGKEERAEVAEARLGGIFDVTVTPLRDETGQLVGCVHVARDITERKRAEKALCESEKQVRRKLDAILSPEANIGALELSDIIDSEKIQKLMGQLYKVTHMGIGIIDLHGRVLVGTGWQDICTKYHRINPEACRLCMESDLELSRDVPVGTFKRYRCKNNMWDLATPIKVGDLHLGNMFLGQFLFDDETVDYETFRQQARRYGFDEQEYVAALDRVPRWSRKTVDAMMSFYASFAEMIGNLSYANVKLASALEERKQAEETLARLSQQRELILCSAAEGILGLDSQGSHTFVNPAAARMLGYEVEELLGGPSHRTWHHTKPDGSPYLDEECGIYAAFREGAVCRASDEVFWRKDGASFPVEYASMPIYEQGQLAGAVVTFTDITARRQAEEALRESEMRHRTLLENLPQKIFLKDRQSVYVSCNDNYARDHKMAPEEIAGRTDYDFYPKELAEKYRGDDKRLMAIGETEELEEQYVQDGRETWVHTIKTPVRDEQGAVV